MQATFLRARAIDQSILEALMLSPERNRSNIGALSALTWDILITMGEEINFIWLTKWTPLKILYFFTRYYAIIILIVLNTQSLTSGQWIILEGISAVLLEISTEVILILRIHAMYEGSRRLTYALFAVLSAQAIVMIVSIGTSIPKILRSPKFAPVIPAEMIAYSVSSILYETLLFTLVAHKCWRVVKEGSSLGGNTLLTVLIRDNIWAFVAVFVVMFVNTFLFTLTPSTLGAVGFPWILAILGSVGPRLVLNVRAEHARVIRDSNYIQTSDMKLSTALAFHTPSTSSKTYSYPYSRSYSYQSPAPTPLEGDQDDSTDDMYIPYTGPKLWVKSGTGLSPADVLRRQKTLPRLPIESSDEEHASEYERRVDEETGLISATHEENRLGTAMFDDGKWRQGLVEREDVIERERLIGSEG